MQTKFKRHQRVRILITPDPEYVEYHDEKEEQEENENQPEIKRGMIGVINIILPNGQYHVAILNDEDEIIAYAPFSEDDLEEIEE